MPVGSNWAGDDDQRNAVTQSRRRAVYRDEHLKVHRQVTALEAAENAWYWRQGDPTGPLVPDTRRCGCHGQIIFPPLPLTDQERAIRHPLSTNVLLGEPDQPV